MKEKIRRAVIEAAVKKTIVTARKTAVSKAKSSGVKALRDRYLIDLYRDWCKDEHKSLALGLILRKLAGR